MESPSTLAFLAIAFCIVMVAIFSSIESAFIASNKLRMRALADSGNVAAKTVLLMMEQLTRIFGVATLSQSLFTVLASSLAAAVAIQYFGDDLGIVVSTVALTYMTVVFAELIPKTLGVSFADRFALFVARPFQIYIKIVTPLVWIFDASANLVLRAMGLRDLPGVPNVTEAEIKAMINIGGEEGTIEEDEQKLLHRVFKFGDAEVSDIMVPRIEIKTIDETATVHEAIALVREHGYSRYPVIRDSVDSITGILYIKDLIKIMAQSDIEDHQITKFTREAYYIPENKMATELLDEMQKRKFHIAVVVDEYGGTSGLVTLEDIMEEIVGGLQDEFEAIEAQKDVVIIDEHTFVVAGQTGLNEIDELVGTNIQSDDFNTIGGFVFGLFGRLPKVGEQLKYHDLRFLIMEMEDRKVSKIKITKV